MNSKYREFLKFIAQQLRQEASEVKTDNTYMLENEDKEDVWIEYGDMWDASEYCGECAERYAASKPGVHVNYCYCSSPPEVDSFGVCGVCGKMLIGSPSEYCIEEELEAMATYAIWGNDTWRLFMIVESLFCLDDEDVEKYMANLVRAMARFLMDRAPMPFVGEAVRP